MTFEIDNNRSFTVKENIVRYKGYDDEDGDEDDDADDDDDDLIKCFTKTTK